jgi:hypothetical protein
VVNNWTDILAQRSTGTGPQTDLRFSPGLDYFLRNDVSIGVDLDLRSAFTPGDHSTSEYGAGIRFGINIPFGDRLSLYPRLTVGGETQRLSFAPPVPEIPGATFSVSGPYVKAYAPLLYQVAPGFFIGAGPYFAHFFGDLTGGYSATLLQTQAGFALEVGGTMGGPEEPGREPTAPSPDPGVEPRRFGARGEIVLDGALGLFGGWSQYTATQGDAPTATHESLAAGLDYFVANHISIGLAGSVQASQQETPAEQQQHFDDTTWGVEARVGFEVPIGKLLSWYPRLGFVWGGATTRTYDTMDPLGGRLSTAYVGAHVTTPFLLHVARHFFLGLGPGYHAEFNYATSASGVGVPVSQPGQSDLEAFFLVGGWLR